MKIKKFEAATEQGALEKVKEEFGADALVLNIKKTQSKGFLALFRKPLVEVTAAFDENKAETLREKMEGLLKTDRAAVPLKEEKPPQPEKADTSGFDDKFKENVLKEIKFLEQNDKIKELEGKLTSTADMLERVTEQLSVYKYEIDRQKNMSDEIYENRLIQIFYDALTSEGVTPEIARSILDDIDRVSEIDKIDINLMVKIVYNAIIMILGETGGIDTENLEPGQTKTLVFIGNTGVGKTTTIAKLSADFILNKGIETGLITADTYRIAAVEQLKIYADILGAEVGVVYTPEDLAVYIELMKDRNKLLLIDTAGRSHKNSEAIGETVQILNAVPDSEKYLVLSLGTRYEDLLDIVDAYSKITDFKIIFTKLDETKNYGPILNVCYKTGKKASYVTTGQNVPDDIELIDPDKIAKALLGLGDK